MESKRIILLSGDTGKTLFPLTNGVRREQFLKLLTDKEGNRESLFQRTYAQICAENPGAQVIVAASESQVDSIRGQLGEDVEITIVPEGGNVPHDIEIPGIGSWKALIGKTESSGNVTQENTQNTLIINELEVPLVALGTKDLVIAASPDGILVSDINASAESGPVFDKVESVRPRYEERRWGEYTVLAQKEHCLVKHLLIKAGKAISLQTHAYRDEVWVITSGEGTFTLDDETRTVMAGDVLKIMRGQKHKIAGISDLHFTEVQLGEKFDESDIIRLDYSQLS
ncbi:MAG: cupin domain-containing protein [Oscillospiraceae bacterium]|jgi:mannose-6-phosphate isomerase-like protein (cupin superfamily)|nr:cupin domain-containing protein [Oscillospiraceae bacterium]